VVQTESAQSRLKRTLRGSDRRSGQVGSGVDQWTTPRRIFLLAAGPDLGGSWRVGGPPRLSRAVVVGGCGADDTYFKKKKTGGPVVQSSSTTPDGAVKRCNRTCRRFEVADLWTTPPGPRWSRVVQPGPGWSSRSSRGPAGPSSPSGQTQRRAERGRQRDRTATVSTVRSGMRRRSHRVPRGGVAHPQAGGQWTRLDHPSLVQGGPGWSRVVYAAWRGRGPAHHPGVVRRAIDAQDDSASIARAY
jgi:hypothetical protein